MKSPTLFYACLIIACFLQNSCLQPKKEDKEVFLKHLLSKMTLEEKIGQLNFQVGDVFNTGPTVSTNESRQFDKLIREGKVTGLFNIYGAAYTRTLQKIAIEESRLGIPLIFGADVIHGFKTISPIPLAEAASWDLKMIEQSARMAALEASSSGINLTFAPMVDIARDPRWGRVAEGSGEDVYLGAAIARARVKGFQGQSLRDSSSVAACVKHFAAYGAPIAGKDYNTVDLSDQELFETYLPPYKAAIDQGAASVMSSFNELNGIPATGNAYLLRTILRDRWRFKGFVVSDWGSIGEMLIHGYSADSSQAALQALEAGTDMDMMSNIFSNKVAQLIKSKKIKQSILDDAVYRILSVKYELGLFQNPYKYCDEEKEKKELYAAHNKEIAREMAKRSIVLLKNESAILPLKKNVKSLAVIGPFADNKEDMNGTWSFFGDVDAPTTILSGIKSKVSEKTKILYAKGCDIYSSNKSDLFDAVNIAKQAEVVLVVVGESAVMNGEGASRIDINIPDHQLDLLKSIKKVNPNTIALLINGRPLTLNWLDENLPAIVETWTLGTEAGNAIADIIFGDYNPSGKLPMTFPRHLGQIPIYYNHKSTGRPYNGDHAEHPNERVYRSRYRELSNQPLYPFGFGLSYSNFQIKDFELDKTKINLGDTLKVNVLLTNHGPFDGEEVVQLYLHDKAASVTRPVKQLKGFKKVFLKNGESQKITFLLSKDDFKFYSAQAQRYIIEPGDFDVYVGNNSDESKYKTFKLIIE